MAFDHHHPMSMVKTLYIKQMDFNKLSLKDGVARVSGGSTGALGGSSASASASLATPVGHAVVPCGLAEPAEQQVCSSSTQAAWRSQQLYKEVPH